MKKTIAGTIAVLATAAAVPLIAGTHGDGDAGGMKDRHHGEHHGGQGMRGHHGNGHAGRGGRIRIMEMIETYDADGDGSVSQVEIDDWRADRLREFDTDGDGQLSLDEYQALWLDAMRERMVDRFQSHDDDGDGQVTIEEFGERSAHLVMMRDRNEDGVLNLDDMPRGRHGDPRDDRDGGRTPGEAGASAQQESPTEPSAPAQQ